MRPDYLTVFFRCLLVCKDQSPPFEVLLKRQSYQFKNSFPWSGSLAVRSFCSHIILSFVFVCLSDERWVLLFAAWFCAFHFPLQRRMFNDSVHGSVISSSVLIVYALVCIYFIFVCVAFYDRIRMDILVAAGICINNNYWKGGFWRFSEVHERQRGMCFLFKDVQPRHSRRLIDSTPALHRNTFRAI